MLTVEEVAMIQVDVQLGRELRVQGKEAEEMAAQLRKELKEMEGKGIVPDVIRE